MMGGRHGVCQGVKYFSKISPKRFEKWHYRCVSFKSGKIERRFNSFENFNNLQEGRFSIEGIPSQNYESNDSNRVSKILTKLRKPAANVCKLSLQTNKIWLFKKIFVFH